MSKQNGYFKIDAEDIDGTEILVPRDEAGVSPEGEQNPDQDYYQLVTRDRAKQYAVFVINDTDADLANLETEGTHLWDGEDWEHAEPIDTEGSPGGGQEVLRSTAAIDFLNQKIEFDAEPTSGELIVVFRSVDR